LDQFCGRHNVAPAVFLAGGVLAAILQGEGMAANVRF